MVSVGARLRQHVIFCKGLLLESADDHCVLAGENGFWTRWLSEIILNSTEHKTQILTSDGHVLLVFYYPK